MIFLFVFKDDQREGNPIYEVNIGLDLVVSALISSTNSSKNNL